MPPVFPQGGRVTTRRFTLVVVVGMLLVGNAAGVDAQSRPAADQRAIAAAASAYKRAGGGSTDDDWHPLREPERQARQQALQERLKQGGSGRIHRTANGQYVEL